MGIADRDYHRTDRREPSGFFSQLTPVVKWLLILNLGIYFLDVMLEGPAGERPLRYFGAFTIQSAVFEGKIWEFVTFQFLHGSLGHVFFNCVGLFFFGPWMERWWGSTRFLGFYLLCGIAGGVFFALLTALHLLPETWVPASFIAPAEIAGLVIRDGMVLYPEPIVGASAGLFGILVGVAAIGPNMRVALLFPPIELSMRQLVMALMAIAAGVILIGLAVSHLQLPANSFLAKLSANAGGEAGHLGGAILGFFLMRFPWILGGRQQVEKIRPKLVKAPPLSKLRPRSDLEKDQDNAVDRILDKISREGFQSLTQQERDFLQKASNSTPPKR